MLNKNHILASIVTILVIGFFFLSKPETSFAGFAMGCCILNNECVGCETGCQVTSDLCDIEGGTLDTSPGSTCVKEPGQAASCVAIGSANGCCEVSAQQCVDDPPVMRNDCFNGQVGNNMSSFFPDQGFMCVGNSCVSPPPIPTLNQWGKIITMVVIGLFALIGVFAMRRRKAVTS